MSSKVVVGTVAGFAAAFSVWSFQRMQGASKLPHTINAEWEAATRKMNAAKERVAAPAIALNPSSSF